MIRHLAGFDDGCPNDCCLGGSLPLRRPVLEGTALLSAALLGAALESTALEGATLEGTALESSRFGNGTRRRRGSRHVFLHHVGLLGALKGADQALLLDGHGRLSSRFFDFSSRPTPTYVAWRVPNSAKVAAAQRTTKNAAFLRIRNQRLPSRRCENSPRVKN